MPRSGINHPASNAWQDRRSYPLPPEVDAKARMAAYPGELGMLLRLGGVVLAGAALVTCLMMAAG